MAKHVYGIDLGSYEIKVYDRDKDTIWTEKNIVAIDGDGSLLAVGDRAFQMNEKTPPNMHVITPMKEGVIAEFSYIQELLQYLLSSGSTFAVGGEYIIAVPADVTELEKRAFFDLLVHSSAKARSVAVIERGVADAIGLGLDVKRCDGVFVANFGGETTELSVLAAGGLIFNRRLKIGGRQMDREIVNRIRRRYNFLIGQSTAERLRMNCGINDDKSGKTVDIAGRDLISGLPCIKSVPVTLVRSCVRDLLDECVSVIRELVGRTPPEIHAIIQKDGLYVAGGLARMEGLPYYLNHSLELHIHTSRKPKYCSIRGLKDIVNDDELRALTYSMQEENSGWT